MKELLLETVHFIAKGSASEGVVEVLEEELVLVTPRFVQGVPRQLSGGMHCHEHLLRELGCLFIAEPVFSIIDESWNLENAEWIQRHKVSENAQWK